jgi:response regulator RpfG family c-di-GMP phosphodiesterase
MTTTPSATTPAANTAVDRILLVDDDKSLLDGLVRLHGRKFKLTIATSPTAAIQEVQKNGPFAVVVCDYQMPGINGAACLAKIQELAPETVRILLTGNNDLETAVDAINRGAIFRFLRKPCDVTTFTDCVTAALRQHELLRGERDLLERTFKGCVQVLCDILSMTNPQAFGRAGRIQYYVKQLLRLRPEPTGWQIEAAALLSQIGLVAVPHDILDAMSKNQSLTPPQRAIVGRHPTTGAELLATIPRLEEVARIVAYQAKRWDGGGYPLDNVQGKQIPLGARVLHAASAFDTMMLEHKDKELALEAMTKQAGSYDPALLVDLAHVEPLGQRMKVQKLPVRKIAAGCVLNQDVVHTCGSLVVPKGQTISESMLARLRNYADLGSIPREIEVLVQDLQAPAIA